MKQADSDPREASPIDAHSEFVWIVGDPIGQVKAPQVMNPHYARAGENLFVVPARIPAAHLPGALASARHLANLRGWIVTVPHKIPVAALVDELSLAARIAGAVNAIRFRDGRASGELFDGVGFTTSLRARGFDVRGCSALVLGAGGVGSAIALALGQAGAARVCVHDLDAARAEALVVRLTELSGLSTRFERASFLRAATIDLIVNASPVGMSGDPRSPIEPSLLTSRHTVAEVVMSPEITPLLAAGKALGCEIHPGRQVLEGQLELLLDFFR